jgi:type III restriction enzyme
MFRGDPALTEYVSIVGTDAFLDFVDSIRSEGVELEKVSMGGDTTPKKPLLVEVDRHNPAKDVEDLDIPLPRLSRRIQRQMKNLEELDAGKLARGAFEIQHFTPQEQREIVFKDLDKDEAAWRTDLGQEVVPTPQAVIAYLTLEIMKRLRLVGGQDVLFGKIKEYISNGLFKDPVDIADLNVLRNLSEPGVRLHLLDVFATAVNELTLSDVGGTEVVTEIKISKTRPSVVNQQEYLESKKTLFNKVVGDSHLELRFASFLDRSPDVTAFVKNARGIHFFIEYVNASGEIAHYYPDFLVRTSAEQVYVVETKGLQDIDVAPKWQRLVLWCEDATALDPRGRTFTPLFLTEAVFDELDGSAGSMQQVADIVASHAPTGV